MKCPNCSSQMKPDMLFTSVTYECQSLYCGLKEENGWYSWSEFKNKHHPLHKSIMIEFIKKCNSQGKFRTNSLNCTEFDETIKFRLIDENNG